MKSFFAAVIFIVIAIFIATFPGPVKAENATAAGRGYKNIKAPEDYGTVLMGKTFTKDSKTVRAVRFPHWAHRVKYQCRVCHTELGFAFRANATNVKQADIEAGKYCGACHDGKAAFAVRECDRCHSNGITVKENSRMPDVLLGLPDDDFGNRINWGNALKFRRIHPADSIQGKKGDAPLELDVIMPADKFYPHPGDVTFPHKRHTEQLDCATCHPAIFNQKKGGNPDMNMMKILSGQYCGTCHGLVAFPLEDCFRCHNVPLPKVEEKERSGKKKTREEMDRERQQREKEQERPKTIF